MNEGPGNSQGLSVPAPPPWLTPKKKKIVLGIAVAAAAVALVIVLILVFRGGGDDIKGTTTGSAATNGSATTTGDGGTAHPPDSEPALPSPTTYNCNSPADGTCVAVSDGSGNFQTEATCVADSSCASPIAASGGGGGGNNDIINCIGSWSTPVCLPTCTEYPTQVKYTISIPSSNGGTACETTDKDTRNHTCPTDNCDSVSSQPYCNIPSNATWTWSDVTPTSNQQTVATPLCSVNMTLTNPSGPWKCIDGTLSPIPICTPDSEPALVPAPEPALAAMAPDSFPDPPSDVTQLCSTTFAESCPTNYFSMPTWYPCSGTSCTKRDCCHLVGTDQIKVAGGSVPTDCSKYLDDSFTCKDTTELFKCGLIDSQCIPGCWRKARTGNNTCVQYKTVTDSPAGDSSSCSRNRLKNKFATCRYSPSPSPSGPDLRAIWFDLEYTGSGREKDADDSKKCRWVEPTTDSSSNVNYYKTFNPTDYSLPSDQIFEDLSGVKPTCDTIIESIITVTAPSLCNIPTYANWTWSGPTPSSNDTNIAYPSCINSEYSIVKSSENLSCSDGTLTHSLACGLPSYTVSDAPQDFNGIYTMSNRVYYERPVYFQDQDQGSNIILWGGELDERDGSYVGKPRRWLLGGLDPFGKPKLANYTSCTIEDGSGPETCGTEPWQDTSDENSTINVTVTGGIDGFQNYVPQPLKETTNWFACRPDINENSKISLLPGFEF